MEIDGLKEATIMLLNDLKCTELSGEIYYTKKNGATIKLGTFEFRPEYKEVKIRMSDCEITYEGDNGDMCLPNTYWFRSTSIDRYHGFIYRDDKWVNNLFEEVSPFTDDINRLLEEFFRIAFDRAQNMPGKQVV